MEKYLFARQGALHKIRPRQKPIVAWQPKPNTTPYITIYWLHEASSLLNFILEKDMKINFRFALKAFGFGVLLAISIFGPLRSAYDDYTDPGSKTRKSTEFVSAYKSPAFTFCFTPPFNSSSNVQSDFFLGQGPKNEEDQWQLQTPVWDLFYQSAFVIGKDFDIKLSYLNLTNLNNQFPFQDEILTEGITDLGNGFEIETFTLPTIDHGMCHVLIPNFDMRVRELLIMFFKFKSTEKPSIVTIYVSAQNEWSMIGFDEYKNAQMYQFDISNEFVYKFHLNQIEFTILEEGNKKCDFGCRFEQCEDTTYDKLTELVPLDSRSEYPPCIPILLKGPYYKTHTQFNKCQNFTISNHYFFIFFDRIIKFSSSSSKEDYKSYCTRSKRSARFTGNYQRYLSPPGDLDKDLKVSFTFPSRELVKEDEEKFVTHLQFFVEVVGSLGAFIDFCFQTYMNRMIDFGFNMLSNPN